ncbi:single-stranded DNA-binding protein [Streptosporangium carneum]|uniref:Single-stranded DNA-binding protein n=1 Tax=Streptosporangium carneum TaxID=47481 RepID=A0A9W6MAW6_9ACTN|nr:single-stranded DNA-binding protein [Streptosporangium carneum]GLK07422.1 single-stranded DNA-binding protein [Streptosporangium carneum]
MADETVITVVGNLTDDPELRFSSSGVAVAHFTVASTSRVYDREAKEWRDAGTLFLRCSVWRQEAEHVAQSLPRGARVIVQGRLRQRTYETKEGERRTVVECEVDEIGPSLRFASARIIEAPRASVRARAYAGAKPSADDLFAQHDEGGPHAPRRSEEPF